MTEVARRPTIGAALTVTPVSGTAWAALLTWTVVVLPSAIAACTWSVEVEVLPSDLIVVSVPHHR